MASSGMLRRVALVRTHVSEEPSASFIKVTRIGDTITLSLFRIVYSNEIVFECSTGESRRFITTIASRHFSLGVRHPTWTRDHL
jgi:hypothetical protein